MSTTPVLRILADPGTRIENAVANVIATADLERRRVVCDFNGTDIEADPGSSFSAVGHDHYVRARKQQDEARKDRLDLLCDEILTAGHWPKVRKILERVMP